VFTAPDGGALRLTNLRRRHWKQAVTATVGEPMRIHDLRHSHAALAIAAGVHPRVLMERLGHRDIRTTLNIYGGLFHGYDEGVANALDEVFQAST
jgi:integrase